MKLLKIYALLTLVVAIALGSTYIINSKTNRIPKKGEILPKEQWIETLQGKWEVSFTIENPSFKYDFKGITTFKEDSSFIDAWNYEYFEYSIFDNQRQKNWLDASGQLTRYGKYEIIENKKGTSLLTRSLSSTSRCIDTRIYPTFDFKVDPCNTIYIPVYVIGNDDWDNGNSWVLLTFSKNKIQMAVDNKDFDDTVVITYTKQVES